MPSASDIKAGGAFLELYTKNGPLYAGLKAAQKKINAFAGSSMAAGKALLGIGAAITGPLVAAAKYFADTGDALDEMAARTGISVEALSELGFAAEQTTGGLETVEAGVKAMQKSLANAAMGLKRPLAALKELGLSVEDLEGLTPDEQFSKLAAAITAVEDPSAKAALAMRLMGGAGTELLPLMEDLAELRQQARDLGLVVSADDAKKAGEFSDQMNILRRVLLDGLFTAGKAVAPMLGELIMRIVSVAKVAADWIEENQSLFTTLLKIGAAIAAAGGLLVALGGAGMVLSGIVGGVATAITVFGSVLGVVGSVLGFLLSPIGLVVAGLVGLAGYFLYSSGAASSAVGWIMDRFGELWGFVQEVYGGIADAMAAGDMQLAAEVLWAGIRVAWTAGLAWIRQQWAELRFFLVDMWGTVAFGVLDTCNFLWSGMVDGFWTAADAIVDAWKWAEKIVAKGVGWIIAQWRGLDPKDVIANLEQDYARQQRGRESGREARDKANKEATDARYAANQTARQEWTAGAEARREADLAAATGDLEEARRRFADAKGAAAEARRIHDAAAKGTGKPEVPKPDFKMAADSQKLATSGAWGTAEGWKIMAEGRDPSLAIQKDQLAVLERIEKKTGSGPTVKEAVPPKR